MVDSFGLLAYTPRGNVVRTVFVRTMLVNSDNSIRLPATLSIFRTVGLVCRRSIFHASMLLTCSSVVADAAVSIFLHVALSLTQNVRVLPID